jgi:hypothetical protein
MEVSHYPAWFHDGAITPDFNTVDIRQTQEFPYTNAPYVICDLVPGVAFIGKELEFNSMTKYFYTNRSLPKHRLSEANMEEINKLYRVIGRCESEINRLAAPESSAGPIADATAPDVAADETRREARIRYSILAIAGLVVLVIILRFVKKF